LTIDVGRICGELWVSVKAVVLIFDAAGDVGEPVAIIAPRCCFGEDFWSMSLLTLQSNVNDSTIDGCIEASAGAMIEHCLDFSRCGRALRGRLDTMSNSTISAKSVEPFVVRVACENRHVRVVDDVAEASVVESLLTLENAFGLPSARQTSTQVHAVFDDGRFEVAISWASLHFSRNADGRVDVWTPRWPSGWVAGKLSIASR